MRSECHLKNFKFIFEKYIQYIPQRVTFSLFNTIIIIKYLIFFTAIGIWETLLSHIKKIMYKKIIHK